MSSEVQDYHLSNLMSFFKNKLPYVWIYLWAFYFVPLIYMSVFVPVPYCLDDCGLGLVHGDDPERCYGEGGGRGVHVWERMYTRGGFMSVYGKPNTVR